MQMCEPYEDEPCGECEHHERDWKSDLAELVRLAHIPNHRIRQKDQVIHRTNPVRCKKTENEVNESLSFKLHTLANTNHQLSKEVDHLHRQKIELSAEVDRLHRQKTEKDQIIAESERRCQQFSKDMTTLLETNRALTAEVIRSSLNPSATSSTDNKTDQKTDHKTEASALCMCVTNTCNLYLSPCGHAICDICFANPDFVKKEGKKICPYCRVPIVSTSRLFL